MTESGERLLLSDEEREALAPLRQNWELQSSARAEMLAGVLSAVGATSATAAASGATFGEAMAPSAAATAAPPATTSATAAGSAGAAATASAATSAQVAVAASLPLKALLSAVGLSLAVGGVGGYLLRGEPVRETTTVRLLPSPPRASQPERETAELVLFLGETPSKTAAETRSEASDRGPSLAKKTMEPLAPPSSSPSPSFYEELTYLRRAQGALRDKNATLALGLMQELDSLQPGGGLLSERRMTQVLALCQLGRIAQARAIGRALTTTNPDSVYARRLEASCAATNTEDKADDFSSPGNRNPAR